MTSPSHPLDGARILITGGAGMIGSTIADRLVDHEPARSSSSTTSCAGARRTSTTRWRRAQSASSTATSATATLVATLMDGIDVVFHQAAIRITQCAEEPRLGARGAGRRHLQRARSRGRRPRSARSSRRRRRRCTAWPTEFPTDEAHHPYDNRRSTARRRCSTRGCSAASTTCTGSTTSRCGTSTSTGRAWTSTASTPRCWSAGWSASRAGEPPLILGDGTQTMDFVYVDDIARANVLAAEAPSPTRSSTSRAVTETSLDDLAHALLG